MNATLDHSDRSRETTEDHLAAERSARIETAKRLLLNRHYKVSEIAAHLGFHSIEHFNQEFVSTVGEPVWKYRARVPGPLCWPA